MSFPAFTAQMSIEDFSVTYKITLIARESQHSRIRSKALADVANVEEDSRYWANEGEMIQKIGTDVSKKLKSTGTAQSNHSAPKAARISRPRNHHPVVDPRSTPYLSSIARDQAHEPNREENLHGRPTSTQHSATRTTASSEPGSIAPRSTCPLPRIRVPRTTAMSDPTDRSNGLVDPSPFFKPVSHVFTAETKLRKFGRARRSSRRPKVTILIWKDRYLSHASRRSGMKPFGSTMRPRLIFYRDMSGKRVNEAHGGFGVSNGPSSSAKGLDRIEKRPG
ncbi:unnamed protein product [Microthlaspi erraticum]|uniref:Uncharacterized protein n=1 Tax=Microthlaspi erraticum TaxID=1685480 RepID=A0A6D2HG54_9BRAS|nr:unnamed protein product [Microthlaspi erraticum]